MLIICFLGPTSNYSDDHCPSIHTFLGVYALEYIAYVKEHEQGEWTNDNITWMYSHSRAKLKRKVRGLSSDCRATVHELCVWAVHGLCAHIWIDHYSPGWAQSLIRWSNEICLTIMRQKEQNVVKQTTIFDDCAKMVFTAWTGWSLGDWASIGGP